MGNPKIQHGLEIKFGSEYGSEEEQAAIEVIRKGAPTSGEACIQFEKDFAEYCGSKYARAVTNGTAALFLSMVGLGIKPGDRVITTPMTWIATAAARWPRVTPIPSDARRSVTAERFSSEPLTA
jgi:dTDP-4-amino-4,6-dideoxygalactose transaminase